MKNSSRVQCSDWKKTRQFDTDSENRSPSPKPSQKTMNRRNLLICGGFFHKLRVADASLPELCRLCCRARQREDRPHLVLLQQLERLEVDLHGLARAAAVLEVTRPVYTHSPACRESVLDAALGCHSTGFGWPPAPYSRENRTISRTQSHSDSNGHLSALDSDAALNAARARRAGVVLLFGPARRGWERPTYEEPVEVSALAALAHHLQRTRGVALKR